MLGVFAKVVLGQSVKTRLQTQLSRQEAENFHVACLADTLETSMNLGAPTVLFLQGAGEPGAVQDLAVRLWDLGFLREQWEQLRIQPQAGVDLGERLEHAIAHLLAMDPPSPCLVVGSDHPSLPLAALRHGMDRLRTHGTRDRGDAAREGCDEGPDLVLGPTEDGGYWCIGCRRPIPGLLRHIAWSTPTVLEQTRRRACQQGLRVALLQTWTDVDHPEDLPVLGRQILTLRSQGDSRTARHTERLLRQIGRMHS